MGNKLQTRYSSKSNPAARSRSAKRWARWRSAWASSSAAWARWRSSANCSCANRHLNTLTAIRIVDEFPSISLALPPHCLLYLQIRQTVLILFSVSCVPLPKFPDQDREERR